MRFKEFLSEATEIETKIASDFWDELSGDANQYVSSTVYEVRPSEKKSGMYDVFNDENGKRTLYASMTSGELKASFEPVRANETPDSEGFTHYRSTDTIDAVKYSGDPVIVDIGGVNAKIKAGDYLTRTTEGNTFEFAVESASFFAKTFEKA